MKQRYRVVLAVALAVGMTACGGQRQPPPEPEPAVRNDNGDAARREAEAAQRRAADEEARRRAADEERRAEEARRLAEAERVIGEMIHFDFDKSNVRADAQAILDRKLAVLRANAGYRIRIEGHCDERGTDDYNMALGNRRAISTKAYLTDRGIEASRIEIVSRGEERPLDSRRNEQGWAVNRRAEFHILGRAAASR
jgi:peptidoglycan-associated lipoprotein